MAESEVECFCRVKTAQNFKTAGSDFWKAPFDFIIKWTAKGFSLTKKEIIIFITLVSPTLSPSGEIIAKISFVFVSAALPAEVAVEEKAI